jgi:hypothetical protein
VGPGFRVAEFQKNEDKQGKELGTPIWEELCANVKNNRTTR